MLTNNFEHSLVSGSNCRDHFQKAYENRYTWKPDFQGYKGTCTWSEGDASVSGNFILSSDLKVNVLNINDPLIHKAITSQLWEVAIHRVRRSFEKTHAGNTFTVGDINDIGMEVIVGGKNKGDRYRIKENVIKMVYRNIHGSLINIFTQEIEDTGHGYLSRKYTSQYLDPSSGKAIKPKNIFRDKFTPLPQSDIWVLSSRSIHTEDEENNVVDKQKFSFNQLEKIY